jgi:hypothetical protein
MNNIKRVCDKCGEEMPEDEEQEKTPNWKIYKNECPCGGKGKFDFS